MNLDVNGKNYSVTSQQQGNWNSAGGILGAASFFGVNAGNLLGGGCGNNRWGWGGNNGCCNGFVTDREQNLAIALAQAQSKEQALQLAREEDSKIADVLKQTNAGLIEVANGVSRNDVRLSCLEEKVQWIREESARNLREAKEYADHLVACEAKERQAADQNVLAYTNAELAKKIEGTLKLDSSVVSYGSCRPILQACPCGSEQSPYFVNSSPADVTAITQAVLAAIKASQATPA